ncbi:MAG: alpha/beta hydrolase [Candidatus Omnitrophica bacterium]|nr:alpha/beta hydrolase [Candidatus Omnitrophota bacterium]
MISVLRFLFTGVICVLAVYIYARYLENSSLYYPEKELEMVPADIGLAYEDVYFTAEDKVKLHGWLVKAENAKYTIIFCHGNAGNISHRIDKIKFFSLINVNTFMFDYRGYGKSEGAPSEQGMYADALAAYKYIIDLSKKANEKHLVIVYGESLGGAVAIDLANKVKLDALITEGTFTCVKDMAKVIYPFLPAVFLKTKFDSFSKVPNVKIPKLFIHGSQDEIVPLRLGEKLFTAAAEPKQFLLIDNAGHNDAFFIAQDRISAAICSFLESINK